MMQTEQVGRVSRCVTRQPSKAKCRVTLSLPTVGALGDPTSFTLQ
jgi:hypothetical protein